MPFRNRTFVTRLRATAIAICALLTATLVAATPAHAALSGPDGLSPNSLSAPISANPVLSWNPVPGAGRYRVQASTQSDFSSTSYDVMTYQTTATPPNELPTGTLYWRVQGIDSANLPGGWSIDQFEKNQATGPELTAPADGASLTFPLSPPLFRWGPLTGYKQYTIEVDDAADFIQPQTFTTPNNSYVLTSNQAAGTYYWHVRGVSATSGVVTQWSETRSYTVPALAAPSLLTPLNTTATSLTDLAMRWTAVAGAATYDVQISPNGDFTNNKSLDQTTKAATLTPTQAL